MAINRSDRYPGRFTPPTGGQPEGAFKNKTAPGAEDGSYLEQDWMNDIAAFFSSLLDGDAATGIVDEVGASQYFNKLQSVLDTYVEIAGDTMTGPLAVPAGGVGSQVRRSSETDTLLDLKAPLASPSLTGVPLAPTATPGTDTTQLATTAFVDAAINSSTTASTATGRYIILPDGLMIQWETISDNVTSGTWTFPLPFAAVIYAKGLTPASSQNLGSITSIRQTAGSTNASIDWFKTTGDTIDLFAIGY